MRHINIKKQNGRYKSTVSMVSLNVNGLNNPIKSEIIRLHKIYVYIQLYAVYKRHTLDSKIQIG